MITTYLIENAENEVMGYYKRLTHAKRDLETYNNPKWRILCLKGQNFGEGYHAYQVVCLKGVNPGAVFLKTKLR
jgi:hypothetical protein